MHCIFHWVRSGISGAWSHEDQIQRAMLKFRKVEHHQIVCISVQKQRAINRQRLGDDASTHLLDSSNISGNVFNGNRVLDSQSVALALYSRLVDEDSSIRGQTLRCFRSPNTIERRSSSSHQQRLGRHGRPTWQPF